MNSVMYLLKKGFNQGWMDNEFKRKFRKCTKDDLIDFFWMLNRGKFNNFLDK